MKAIKEILAVLLFVIERVLSSVKNAAKRVIGKEKALVEFDERKHDIIEFLGDE